MLNISENNKITVPTAQRFSTLRHLDNRPHYKILNRIIVGVSLFTLMFLFFPWTQNISGSGSVTTLRPDQRPQAIQSVIGGRIEKWYVKEGDFVKKGDTILFISEVKEEYFDPNLVGNIKNQVDAKKSALNSYDGKIASLSAQIKAINSEGTLKIRQALNKIRQSELKIKSDSMDFEATKTQVKIALIQFNRSIQLNKEGLKAMTDVEEKRLKLQETEAKLVTIENKLLITKNELINAKLEISRIESEYAEMISKTNSDQFTAVSNQFETKAQVSKLENQFQNYSIRNGHYYIKAEQNGYVNRALQAGLGEVIKEGTPIVSIMPDNFEIAVASFVNPVDLPLLSKGDPVRIWFDGWPTIIFSGWPGMSYGTFGGRIVAIENFISDNGKYRILIAPDPDEPAWPKQVSVGSGTQSIALLETVPIWFELWRTLNGFPPNYYTSKSKRTQS